MRADLSPVLREVVVSHGVNRRVVGQPGKFLFARRVRTSSGWAANGRRAGLKTGRKALCRKARFGARFEKISCRISVGERTSEPPH
jgi:hypothetical protein